MRASCVSGLGWVGRAVGLAKAGCTEATQAYIFAFAREGRPGRRDRRTCACRLRLKGDRCWVLLPAPRRSCDERCSSGIGSGQSSVACFRAAARGVGRREPAGPWLVKPRLVSGRAVVSWPKGLQRRGRHGATRSRRSTWRTGPQPRPEVSSKSSASWMRRLERTPRGSGDRMAVLAGCSGCRTRRAASGPGVPFAASRKLAKNSLGPGHPASCSGGERAPEAGFVVETSRIRCQVVCDPVPLGHARRKPCSAGRPGASRSGGDSTRRTKASWFQQDRRL
jgi:hypothetical protein